MITDFERLDIIGNIENMIRTRALSKGNLYGSIEKINAIGTAITQIGWNIFPAYNPLREQKLLGCDYYSCPEAGYDCYPTFGCAGNFSCEIIFSCPPVKNFQCNPETYEFVCLNVFTEEPLVQTTKDITNNNAPTAESGGVIASIYTIVSRGVCWDTNTHPDIEDDCTTDGSGTGEYSSTLTGLTVGLTYYVRAYSEYTAWGSNFYFYGNEVSFVAAASTATIISFIGVEWGDISPAIGVNKENIDEIMGV